MAKRTLFFILLSILGGLIVIYSYNYMVEPFKNAMPGINIPMVKPAASQIGEGDPQPFTPPSTALLSPPPGQTASVNSYPAKDPAMQPATLKRIKGVYKLIGGFIQSEASGLESLGDPAIKLPLESLKADFRTLEDETLVLTKNPGVQSTLSETDVKGMEANLRFLQKKWRTWNGAQTIEGFQGDSWYGDFPQESTYNTGSTGPTGPSDSTDFTDSTGPTGSNNSRPNDDYGNDLDWLNIPDRNFRGSTGPTGSTGSTGSNKTYAIVKGLKLDLDYNTNVGEPNSTTYNKFITDIREEIASALNITTDRIIITSIESGSIIVSFAFTPGPYDANLIASAFLSLIISGRSFPGKYLGKIDPNVTPSRSSSTSEPTPVDTGNNNRNNTGNNTGNKTGSTGNNSMGPNSPASLYQLQELVLRISAEVTRLQSSGTTDQIITARINSLNSVKSSVNNIIRQVQSGAMLESNIPILQSSYINFLQVMSNYNSALPNILSRSGASDVLNNLFPFYNSGDISGAKLARSIFDKYVKDINNLSWDLNLRYTGNTEKEIVGELAKGFGKSVLGTSASSSTDSGSTHSAAPSTSYRGMFESIVKNVTDSKATHSAPSNPSAPAKLNWKDRSREICEMISRRGLNPYEYGCMKDTSTVSETFSFRGYAKMICNRLSTNYDPGIPELCGCPDATWPGWRG